MSKINALRIINLNYNNNTIKIDDEIFDFASESTLMSLRNGGGKTVLVQMMMAPFVSKRNRDLKDRKFKTYFGNNPTYILTEWKLDDEGGYLLVGMGVRKKLQASDEDSTDELDIFTFIHHYDQKSKYDIYQIPIIDTKKDGRKSIKGYQSFKTELEEAKKGLRMPLDVYNMNVFEQSKKYFQKLREYKIDNKEWDIIHKINLKESGLSELFSDTKNVEGLVEKWFLTTIEDKLNKTGNKIKNFNEIVRKYIFEYKEIQSKIEKKDTVELFCNELEVLINEGEILNESEKKLEEQKSIIANFINYLKNLSIKIEKEMQDVQNKIIGIKNEIDDLKYQEISKDWHEKDFELDKINNLLNEIFEKQTDLERAKENVQRQFNIFECAELYEEYKDNLKTLRERESMLENISKTEEEKAPERNDLGYSLRLYYENELNTFNDLKGNVRQNIDSLNDDIDKAKSLNHKFSDQKTQSIKKQTELSTLINSFEKDEDKFEKLTKITLSKNLLGMYEEDFLEKTEKSINNNIQVIEDKKLEINDDTNTRSALVELKNNDQQNLKENKQKLNHMLENSIKKKAKYEEEINFRINIVRILNMSNDDVYNKSLIIGNMEDKINHLIKKRDELTIEKSNIENEKTKLEKGILTEIPLKLKEKLDELDIKFLYGMDWLNKNKKTSSDNETIIKNNPFLPYSLILSEEDINKLQKSNMNEFVSTPIPIIKKSSINDEIATVNNLLKFDSISFYISFNKKLIDKNELHEIINEKENELKKLIEKINLNNDDKKDFEEKLYKLNESTVEQKLYDELSEKICNLKSEISKAEDKIIKNEAIIKQCKTTICENNEKYQFYIDELSRLNRYFEQFIELKNNYNKYLVNKEQLKVEEKAEKEINLRINDNDSYLNRCTDKLQEEKEHMNNIKNDIKDVEKIMINFTQYKDGNIINRDFEVIKSDYDTLTSQITSDRKYAEDMKNDADNKFKKSQEKLLAKQNEYGLLETDYNNLRYDSFKHKEIKNDLKYTEELLKKQIEEIHKYEIEKTKIEETLKNLLSKINEKFGTGIPKEKEYIMNINFKIEIKLKSQEKEQFEKTYKNKENEFNIVTRNIDRLDQYNSFIVKDFITIDKSIEQIENYKNELEKSLNERKDETDKSKIKMQKSFESIYSNNKFKSEAMSSASLETIKDCMDKTGSFLEQLNIVLKSCQTIIDKLQVDIEFIYKDEEEVLAILFDYVKDVHENLSMIDDNSSVKIEGKSIKMLKIKLPEWDLNKERYKDSLKFILEKLRAEALKKLADNEAVDEIISKNISTNYLYNNVVGLSNIEVKLYKIEETRQSEISWNNVSTNSGGEGFLSAFVILSSLLTYMRKDETDIFSNNRDSKVIVMDNPFAQTNASHLLKPLMSIAEKSNTQLICFSGLGGDSIYNRFDNIYVLDTIQSKLNLNQQYLKHTHEKGEEYVNKIYSSRFRIEEKSIEQITLF